MKKIKATTLIGVSFIVIGFFIIFISFCIVGFNPNKFSSEDSIVMNEESFDFCEEIIIDSTTSDIYIVKGLLEEIKVEYYHNEAVSYSLSLVDNIIKIKQTGDKVNTTNFSFKNLFSNDDFKLIIRIPETFTPRINIKNSDGNINVQNVTVNLLTIKNGTGDISLREVNSKADIFASTNSGELTLGDSEANNITGKTIKGLIKCIRTNAKSISLVGTNGDTDIEKCEASLNLNLANSKVSIIECKGDSFILNVNTGNVDCMKMDFKESTTNLTSGKFIYQALGCVDDYLIKTIVKLGDANIDDTESGNRKIESNVTCGSIQLTFYTE